MKLLHKLNNKSYIYINEKDQKLFGKLIKTKDYYQWRFVAPDQIPPYPPSTLFIKNKDDKFCFVTDLSKKKFIDFIQNIPKKF